MFKDGRGFYKQKVLEVEIGHRNRGFRSTQNINLLLAHGHHQIGAK